MVFQILVHFQVFHFERHTTQNKNNTGNPSTFKMEDSTSPGIDTFDNEKIPKNDLRKFLAPKLKNNIKMVYKTLFQHGRTHGDYFWRRLLFWRRTLLKGFLCVFMHLQNSVNFLGCLIFGFYAGLLFAHYSPT